MRRLIFPILLGLVGCAVLAGLGVWQLARLDWKEAYLAELEAAAIATPGPLPAAPGPGDAYRAVEVTGTVGQGALRFVHAATDEGLVVPLDLVGGRTILADLGLTPAGRIPDLEGTELTVIGNLAFPMGAGPLRLDQANGWNARNLAAMARMLGTEEALVVARDVSPDVPGVAPLPISTDTVPNNHLGYAIQWFALAGVWAAMSLYLIHRVRRREEG